MADSKQLAQVLLKLSQKKDSEKSVHAFFDYLRKKSFVSLLPQIKEHLHRQIKKSLFDQTLIIRSKYELSPSEREEIISLIGADKNVNVKMIIDDSIIGGFSATYRGNIYDGSLKNQITQLSAKLRE